MAIKTSPIYTKTLFTRHKDVKSSSMLLHWMIHIIMGLSIVAGLWQHGDPLLTLIMVCASLPLGLLIYVPVRIFNNFARTLLQFIVITGALLWGVFRLIHHVPPDKFLIESFALLGLSLSFLPSTKNYGYQFLISIIMIIYGGVYPRVVYVYVLPAILFCGLIAAYQTRTLALANDANAGIPAKVFRNSWLYILIHIVMAICFGVYIYILFPNYFNPNMGLIVVSYKNANESYVAPKFNRWIRTKYVRKSPIAKIEIKTSTKEPTDIGESGPVIPGGEGKDTWNASGSGSAPPGKDLVFRVASPVKLYWLANLYDIYDGKEWKASEKMQRASVSYNSFRDPKRIKFIPQQFVIEKWLSPTLYAAYMPTSYYLSTEYYTRSMRKKLYPAKKKVAHRKYKKKNFTVVKKQKKKKGKTNSAKEKFIENLFKPSKTYHRETTAVLPSSKYKTQKGKKGKRKDKYSPRMFTFYHRRLEPGKHYPRLPFIYEVSSLLFLSDDKPAPNISDILKLSRKKKNFRKTLRSQLWFENISPAHYLQLPIEKKSHRIKKTSLSSFSEKYPGDIALSMINPAEKTGNMIITERTRKLALSITKGIKDDYEKAIALRDYLRTHYTYEQFAEAVPPNRETVDYFLFTLKKGHCEYFASALTVLCRLNNIPARIATGFSPGDYNILTGYFEVYEYNAHAWTQVFIAGKGWLTLDATPPGNIRSRTVPIGLAQLSDPFGDEWRVTPPELTTSTRSILRQMAKAKDSKNILEKLPPEQSEKITKVVLSIPITKEEFKESIKKIKKQIKGKTAKKKIMNIWERIKKNTVFMFKRFLSMWKNLINWLVGINGLIITAVVLLLITIVYVLKYLYRKIYAFIKLTACKRELKKAKANLLSENPPKIINVCYEITREILNLAGFPRNNRELFDYGASLKYVDRNLCKDTLVIFFLYSKFAYSTLKPARNDAEEVIKRAENVLTFLSEKV